MGKSGNPAKRAQQESAFGLGGAHYQWTAAPWRVVLKIVETMPTRGDLIKVVGQMPYGLLDLEGRRSRINIERSGSEQDSTVVETAAQLAELEDAGTLRWDDRTQTVYLLPPAQAVIDEVHREMLMDIFGHDLNA